MALPVASFDAEMRVRVHLDVLGDDVSADGVAEVLGLTTEEIFGALALEENTGICAEFYDVVRGEFGEVYRYVVEGGREERIVLPARGALDQRRQVGLLLSLNYATVGQLEILPLPRKDLVVPVSDVSFKDLQERFGYAKNRTRVLDVYDVADQDALLKRLSSYVRKLEKSIEESGRLTKQHGSTLAAVSKSKTIVMLQERHFKRFVEH